MNLSYRWSVLFITTVGSFVGTFSSSIVNIAIPIIAEDLKVGFFLVQWIVLAFFLSLSAPLIIFGRLGDLKGRKRLLTLGFVTFALGSALCSISRSGEELLLYRLVQGLGAALLTVNGLALLADVIPADERGKAFGVNVTGVYLGLTTGPVVGGFLLSAFGWQSIFLLNVPLGLFMGTLAHLKLEEPFKGEVEGFDVKGSFTLPVWVALLIVGSSLGSREGLLSLPSILLFSHALTIAILFMAIEARTNFPLLDPALLKNRTFFTANLSALLTYLALSSVSFLMPFYLITIMRYSPSMAGTILLFMPLMMTVSSPLSGWACDKVGSRSIATVGIGVMCTGLYFLSTLGLDSTIFEIALILVLIGLGMGLFSAPNTRDVMASAPRPRLGVASAFLALMRTLGMSLGVALAVSIATLLMPSGLRTALVAGELLYSPSLPVVEFFNGIRLAFSAAALTALLATITSWLRGSVREANL